MWIDLELNLYWTQDICLKTCYATLHIIKVTLDVISPKNLTINFFLTLYVSQFRKKLTDPSMRRCMTVQPPGSCLWSHQTCISLLVFSGFTRYMPLLAWPSSRACKQSLNGPVLESRHMRYLSHGFLYSISEFNVKIQSDVVYSCFRSYMAIASHGSSCFCG